MLRIFALVTLLGSFAFAQSNLNQNSGCEGLTGSRFESINEQDDKTHGNGRTKKLTVIFDQQKSGSVVYDGKYGSGYGSYQCYGSEGKIDFLDVGLQMLDNAAYNKDSKILYWKQVWYKKTN